MAGLQAGLTLINAVFTYRQRAVRFTEGLYDDWQKYQRSLAAQPKQAGADTWKRGGDGQSAQEARLARAAVVAEGIHGASADAMLTRAVPTRVAALRPACCTCPPSCVLHGTTRHGS